MTDDISFFTHDGADLVPTALACSMWSDDQLHGVAVSGALARAAEECLAATGRTDLRPARWVVDLFRAARMQPCTFETTVVREGSRICLIDVTLRQGDVRVARASATFLKPSVAAPGEVWQPDERPSPPPLDIAPESDQPRVPFLCSSAGWSQDFTQHQNGDRKGSWTSAIPVVPDEPLTPFQAVAAAADGASMVTNWGTNGVEYINTDIALTIARTPVGVEIGLLATDRVEHDGIASCTTTVYDRAGALGTVTVAALANARRAVDMGGVEYSDDGQRRGTRV